MKIKYYYYIGTLWRLKYGILYSYSPTKHIWYNEVSHLYDYEISEEDALLKIMELGG